MSATADFSDLDRLTADLERAERSAEPNVSMILDIVVPGVAAEARANAASYGGTGELAASIQYDGAGLTRRVHAPVRQAFFLEYGSPSTGAPRPWITGPAERGASAVLTAMRRAGDVW